MMARGYKSWRLPGHGGISEHMILALEYMIAQDDQYGGAWCDLRQFHQTTIYSLMRRDWVQMSKRPDGHVDYKLTLRGRKALQAWHEYTPKEYRRDGLCPQCGVNPKGRNSNYCGDCMREYKRVTPRARGVGVHYKHVGKTCRKCRKRPIVVNHYCSQCNYKRQLEYRQNQAAQIEQGEREIPMCPRCQKSPRMIMPSAGIASYCRECDREISRENYQQRRRRKLTQKLSNIRKP